MTTKKKNPPLAIEQQNAFRKIEREAYALESGELGFCTDEPENELGKSQKAMRK